MVKILLFKMTAEYKVATTELINTVVNKIRFGDIKWYKYVFGPCKTPNDTKNKIEPMVQSIPNFRGLMANTGNIKKHSVKQSNDARRQQANPTSRSNLESWNQEDSCTASASWLVIGNEV